jgi:hypothetical protein
MESRLALAALRCHESAHRASLAGVRGMYFLDAARGLVVQSAGQHAPAGSQDPAVQPGFLPDFAPRPLARATGRTGHASNTQILNANQVEPPGQASRGLLYPVSAAIGFTSLQAGDCCLDPVASGRPPTCPGQFALQASQPSLLGWAQPRAPQQFTCRQRCRYGHAAVDTHDLASSWTLNGCRGGGERDVPAPGSVIRDPIRTGRGDSPGPAEPNPSSLGYPDLANLAGHATDVGGLDRNNAEAFVSPFLAPSWLAVGSSEVEDHGLGEVPKRLLLHHLATFGKPSVLGTGRGQLGCLRTVPRGLASAGTPPGLLLNGQVPHVSGVRAMLAQDGSLRWCGCQPVSGHASNLVATTDTLGEVGRRCPCGMNRRMLALRIR